MGFWIEVVGVERDELEKFKSECRLKAPEVGIGDRLRLLLFLSMHSFKWSCNQIGGCVLEIAIRLIIKQKK